MDTAYSPIIALAIIPALTDAKRARFRQPDVVGPGTRVGGSSEFPPVSPSNAASERHAAHAPHALLHFVSPLFFLTSSLYSRSRARRGRSDPSVAECRRCTTIREWEPYGFQERAGRDGTRRDGIGRDRSRTRRDGTGRTWDGTGRGEARRDKTRRLPTVFTVSRSTFVLEISDGIASSFILGDGLVLPLRAPACELAQTRNDLRPSRWYTLNAMRSTRRAAEDATMRVQERRSANGRTDGRTGGQAGAEKNGGKLGNMHRSERKSSSAKTRKLCVTSARTYAHNGERRGAHSCRA